MGTTGPKRDWFSLPPAFFLSLESLFLSSPLLFSVALTFYFFPPSPLAISLHLPPLFSLHLNFFGQFENNGELRELVVGVGHLLPEWNQPKPSSI